MANDGLRTRPNVLVLESVWDDDDIRSSLSVVPFFEGWASTMGVRVGFRNYHNREGLKHWMTIFSHSKTNPSICYIAGHGIGNMLAGAVGMPNINLANLIESEVFPIKGRPPNIGKIKKGILIGACEVGNDEVLKRIIGNTNKNLSWIAGYSVKVPWLESTMADLLFLSSLISGRCTMIKGEMLQKKTANAETAAAWLKGDYPLAEKWGFAAHDRKNL